MFYLAPALLGLRYVAERGFFLVFHIPTTYAKMCSSNSCSGFFCRTIVTAHEVCVFLALVGQSFMSNSGNPDEHITPMLLGNW